MQENMQQINNIDFISSFFRETSPSPMHITSFFFLQENQTGRRKHLAIVASDKPETSIIRLSFFLFASFSSHEYR